MPPKPHQHDLVDHQSRQGAIHAVPREYAPEIETDLTGYVVEKGIAGALHYLAQEEAANRKNPAKRTMELLKRVFGGCRCQ